MEQLPIDFYVLLCKSLAFNLIEQQILASIVLYIFRLFT